MFGWFKEKEVVDMPDNIYTTLNDELERMHYMLKNQMHAKQKEGNNAQTLYTQIEKIQNALLRTLAKQPTSEEQLKDLQDSVADLYLTGTESKDN